MRTELPHIDWETIISLKRKTGKTYCQLSGRFSTHVLISFGVERHLFSESSVLPTDLYHKTSKLVV